MRLLLVSVLKPELCVFYVTEVPVDGAVAYLEQLTPRLSTDTPVAVGSLLLVRPNPLPWQEQHLVLAFRHLA